MSCNKTAYSEFAKIIGRDESKVREVDENDVVGRIFIWKVEEYKQQALLFGCRWSKDYEPISFEAHLFVYNNKRIIHSFKSDQYSFDKVEDQCENETLEKLLNSKVVFTTEHEKEVLRCLRPILEKHSVFCLNDESSRYFRVVGLHRTIN